MSKLCQCRQFDGVSAFIIMLEIENMNLFFFL